MKKVLLSFIIVVLLTACQPAATATEPPTAIPQPLPSPTVVPTLAPTIVPTPVITEELANSVDLVKGVWFDTNYGGWILSINGSSGSSDLTYSAYSPQSVGTAKFEDGKFTYLTHDSTCAKSPPATYEFYIIKEDGFITSMRQKPVGTDACVDRSIWNNDIFYYSGPAAMPPGIERPAKRSNEVIGLWYADGLVLDYQLGRLDPPTGNADIVITLYWSRVDPWTEMGTGTARYENGKLTFLTNEGTCEGSAEATYEINAIVRNGKLIGMHPKVIGDDLCKDRKDTLNDRIIRRVNQLTINED